MINKIYKVSFSLCPFGDSVLVEVNGIEYSYLTTLSSLPKIVRTFFNGTFKDSVEVSCGLSLDKNNNLKFKDIFFL